MRTAEVLIVGGGFAGALLQRALGVLAPGQTLLVSADRCPASNGTNNSVSPPVALVHPFPGRTFRCDAFRATVLNRSLPLLAELAAELPSLVSLQPVIRPLDGPAGTRLMRSFLQGYGNLHKNSTNSTTNSTHGTQFNTSSTHLAGNMQMEVTLFDRAQLAAEFPGIQAEAGALVCRPGYAISMGDLVVRLRQPHVQDEIHDAVGATLQQDRADGKWLLLGADGRTIAAGKQVVLATGVGIAQWFPGSNAVVEAGQLLRLVQSPVPALISRGDVHYAPHPNGAVVGSTRWREDIEPPIPPQDAVQQLLGKVRTLLHARVTPATCTPPVPPPATTPALAPPAGSAADPLWSGRRCSLPDRRPVVGPLPGAAGVFLLGGFGGTGGLYAPWAANVLAEHLVSNIARSGGQEVVNEGVNSHIRFPFPSDALPARFGEECWTSPHVFIST